jgi:transketolase
VDTQIQDYPLADKRRAFGWEVVEIHGHDNEQIVRTLEWAREFRGRPVMIIAHTIKGKGVSFMENQVVWHGKAPCREEAEQAIRELRSCLV